MVSVITLSIILVIGIYLAVQAIRQDRRLKHQRP
jgi:hypothetical protein